MNKTVLIGRLTRDIELKNTLTGKAVANFTLAIDRTFKNKDGTKETDFINCQAWGKTAEILVQYTHKGSKIATVGRIQTRNYEKDGERKYITEVVVDEFEFLDNKKDNAAQPKEDNLNDIDFHLMEDDTGVPF